MVYLSWLLNQLIILVLTEHISLGTILLENHIGLGTISLEQILTPWMLVTTQNLEKSQKMFRYP